MKNWIRASWQLGITAVRPGNSNGLLGHLTQELSPIGALEYGYDRLSNLTTPTFWKTYERQLS